jgi:hypothetical protein
MQTKCHQGQRHKNLNMTDSAVMYMQEIAAVNKISSRHMDKHMNVMATVQGNSNNYYAIYVIYETVANCMVKFKCATEGVMQPQQTQEE